MEGQVWCYLETFRYERGRGERFTGRAAETEVEGSGAEGEKGGKGNQQQC
jgi:hypothetical protein